VREPANILLVHRYLWPQENSAYGYMVRELATFHRGLGDQVTVLTAEAQSNDESAARDRWAREHDISLIELALKPDRGRSAGHRVFASLRFSLRALATVFRGRYDAVSVGSYPFLIAPLLVLVGARLTGARSLFYVQDILGARLRRRPGAAGLAGRLVGAVDRSLVALATTTVTLTEDMKQTLGDPTIVVLQNYVVDPVSPADPRPSDRPQMIYAGNFGVAQNLDHIIDAAVLANEQRDFTLLLLGGGSERSRIGQAVAELGVDFIEVQGPVGRVAAGSKSLNYLAHGLGVVMLCEPEVRSVADLVEAGVATVGSPSNPSSLAAAMVAQIDAMQGGDGSRNRIAVWADKHLSKQVYLDLYSSQVLPAWLSAAPAERSGTEGSGLATARGATLGAMGPTSEPTEANTEAFYDEFWTDGVWSGREPNHDEQLRIDALTRLVADHDLGPRILDVGCGRGVVTTALARHGSIVGIDVVKAGVERGRQLYPELDLRHMSVGELNETNEDPFDLVVSTEVIEHVSDAEKATFVHDIAASLRPGGSLLLTTPRAELQDAWQAHVSLAQPREDWLTEPELDELLESAGLKIAHRERIGVYPVTQWRRPLVVGPTRRLAASFPPLRRLIDRAGIYQVVVATKL